MKRSPVITTVESTVWLLEEKLRELTAKQEKRFWFWKKKVQVPTVDVTDYKAVSFVSMNVAVRGKIRICYATDWDKHFLMQIPAQPQFLATCIKDAEGNYASEIVTSLS